MIKVDNYEITQRFFPDGTYNLTDLGGPFSDMAKDAQTCGLAEYFCIHWAYDNDGEMSLLYFLVNHLRDKCGAKTIDLILPYIPNARMDRTKNPYTEVHTLKYFAKFINSLEFSQVYVLDAHSDVSLTLIDRVEQMDVAELIEEAINESGADYLYFPDAGAMKRYTANPRIAIRPYLYGEKDRDWKTGKINGIIVMNPYDIKPEDTEGKTILIIDDICSKGGTFYFGGKALTDSGFNFGAIDLWITHCENSIFAGKLLGAESPLRDIYTTDTLKHSEHDKLHVFGMEYT